MIREAIATGNTIDEAKEAALNELGIVNDSDIVQFEIITMPQKKTFGLFGGSLAKIKAYVEIEDPKPEQKKQSIKSEKKPISIGKKAEIKQERPERKAAEFFGDINNPKILEAKKYLEKILSNMGIENLKIECVPSEGGVQMNFDGDNLGIAIGRKGETLDSIQHIVSLSANRTHGDYIRITLNPGGYREKREKTLEEMAKNSAEQAIKTGKNVILDPMNSYERRIVHNAIQETEGITSWSIGENENRRICIGNRREGGSFAAKNYDHKSKNVVSSTVTEKKETVTKRPNSNVNREQKKDVDSAPLYGKIK